MSTRGSNDNIITMLVFATIYFLLKKQYTYSAILYGLSVHFKIYPIIYCFVFYFFIDQDKATFFTPNRIKFTLISASTFLALHVIFYFMYGYQFISEAYLYHFTRKDNRHNYSIFWYVIYQMYDMESSKVMAVLSFLP